MGCRLRKPECRQCLTISRCPAGSGCSARSTIKGVAPFASDGSRAENPVLDLARHFAGGAGLFLDLVATTGAQYWTFSYVLNVIVIAWLTLLPLYFILILPRARVPAQLPVPPGYRVAMVVTKVPSEPFRVVRETLEAMLRQTYPHDTWLADEDPSSETIKWCREHGVMISTRKDRIDYHQPAGRAARSAKRVT